MTTFAEQKKAWANPPVDDVGYISSTRLLTFSDDELIKLIRKMWEARYYGWRNFDNHWREILALDDTSEKIVLDYGCGVGLESLEYARTNNEIYVSDIVPENILLTERVLNIFGHAAKGAFAIQNRRPYISGINDGLLDVVHCSGVLHHIPKPVPVVAQMSKWLKSGGELRLMLYTDAAWRLTTRTEPPDEVTDDPNFMTFVRAMDGVGKYADWYDRQRLEDRFGEWFKIKRFRYITTNQMYLAAALERL